MLESDMTATDTAAEKYNAPTTAERPFRVVLINPYELGRQPFALASPTAWLARDGFAVDCLDLSLQKLNPATLAGARSPAIAAA